MQILPVFLDAHQGVCAGKWPQRVQTPNTIDEEWHRKFPRQHNKQTKTSNNRKQVGEAPVNFNRDNDFSMVLCHKKSTVVRCRCSIV